MKRWIILPFMFLLAACNPSPASVARQQAAATQSLYTVTIASTISPSLPPIVRASATPQPTFARARIKFDEGVTALQRNEIQHAYELALDYFGDAGGPAIGAFANVDALIEDWTRNTNRALDRPEVQERRKLLLNGPSAFTDGRFFYIYVANWKYLVTANRYYTFLHEYFHVVQNHLVGRSDKRGVPFWFVEGSADFGADRVLVKNGLKKSGELWKENLELSRAISAPLSLMESRSQSESIGEDAGYTLGYLACEYLAANYGEQDVLRTFWETLGRKADVRNAFVLTFDAGIDQFYSKFEEWRKIGFPPFPTQTPTPRP